MASMYFTTEEQSSNRLSLFDGTNYSYWKTRMSFYLKSLDFDLWSIVVDGYKKPPRVFINGNLVEKAHDKYY